MTDWTSHQSVKPNLTDSTDQSYYVHLLKYNQEVMTLNIYIYCGRFSDACLYFQNKRHQNFLVRFRKKDALAKISCSLKHQQIIGFTWFSVRGLWQQACLLYLIMTQLDWMFSFCLQTHDTWNLMSSNMKQKQLQLIQMQNENLSAELNLRIYTFSLLLQSFLFMLQVIQVLLCVFIILWRWWFWSLKSACFNYV